MGPLEGNVFVCRPRANPETKVIKVIMATSEALQPVLGAAVRVLQAMGGEAKFGLAPRTAAEFKAARAIEQLER